MKSEKPGFKISIPSAPWPWLSLGISLVALLLSVYGARQTYKTSRLAVMPYVQISFMFNEKGSGWTYRNMGPGLAIVKSFEVFLDNRRVDSWIDVADAGHLPRAWTFTVPAPGSISTPFKNGEATEIFWLPPPNDKLLSLIDRVRITTCYCSIYGECWKSTASKDTEDASPEEVVSCPVIPPENRFKVKIYTQP